MKKNNYHYLFVFIALMLAALIPAARANPAILSVLAWPGYADEDLVKEFEQLTNASVTVTYIDSDAAMWQRVNRNNGQDFDVFAVNTAELQRYIAADLVLPLNRADIPNTARQLPRFREVERVSGLVHDGKLFAVPYTYSEMGLIYDKRQVPEEPDSVAALWDEQYKDKVLLYAGGVHNFSLTSQLMNNVSPFRIAEDQWPEVVGYLIDLRRNASLFYTKPDESVRLFIDEQAALMFANYGMQQVSLLKAAGVDVGYAIPKEGAMAWLDCWAVTRRAKNPKLAEQWINYMLESKPSQALLDRQGLANTVSEVSYLKDSDRIIWLDSVEDEAKRERYWERIISGDRAVKVLAE